MGQLMHRTGILTLELKLTGKEGEEAKMIHMAMDCSQRHQYELMSSFI